MIKVSVIIPVYNAASFVAKAVESALQQPETGEVILIEDGSSDNSLARCEKLAAENPKVRVLQHPNGENRGAGASRNLAIERARFPLIAFLDADDYFAPDWLATATSLLAADPDADGVYAEAELFADADGAGKHPIDPDWPERIGIDCITAPEELFETLLTGKNGSFCVGSVLMRSTVFAKSGLFEPRFPTSPDTHLWIRMAAKGRLIQTPIGTLALHCRVHGGNRVTGKPRQDHRKVLRAVWMDLIQWGKTHGLKATRIQLLAKRYLSVSRGILLEQPFPQAWKTALASLTFLLFYCPRCWRVPGFRDLLREASGLGLLWPRLRERLMYGAPRAIPSRRHRIALILGWFGEWPFWMPAFLVSCAKNPSINWFIFSNSPPPETLPANVKIWPTTLEAFNKRATQALGVEVNIPSDYAYKLCDLKIAYGRIFEQELREFDFWGCCDMDIVWGKIRRFLLPSLLNRYDVITSRPNRIAGHFCLFRNTPEITDLFRSIPNLEQHILANRECRRLDENELTKVLTRADKDVLGAFIKRKTQNSSVPRVYWEQFLAPNGRHQLRLLEDESLCMRWQDGRVYDADSDEMMYLHFHRIRRTMTSIDFSADSPPREFAITATGFFASRETTNADGEQTA